VDISWDTAAGRAGLDDAIEFALRVRGEYSSRVEPVLVPYEVARSTPDLIRTVAEASEKYDLLVTTHCAEAQLEVFRTLSAHGCTPVEYLERHGLLGPRTLLGHCVFVDEHSSLLTSQKKDLSRIAEAGASVAHSPLPYARRGLRLESFDSYIDSGVNVALGTDSIPQDVFYEMKLVSLMSKVTERSFEAGHADRVFNAATVGGARALGRQDIGVLTAGARADILVIDSLETSMGPIRNPISSLVHLAQSRDLASVFVDGREIYSRDAQHNESVDRLKHEVQGSAEKVWSYFEGQYVSDSFGQQVIPKVQ
jgi:cytosine/adenosine deaminase-related metal-dependent hydrolase